MTSTARKSSVVGSRAGDDIGKRARERGRAREKKNGERWGKTACKEKKGQRRFLSAFPLRAPLRLSYDTRTL
jgi:hypothetical protein